MADKKRRGCPRGLRGRCVSGDSPEKPAPVAQGLGQLRIQSLGLGCLALPGSICLEVLSPQGWSPPPGGNSD